MPWRGPNEPGEFPTLGYDIGEWIEEHLVIPDGYRKGEPYVLTDEMWEYLIWYYRLYPHAAPWPAPDAYSYYGGQLRRSQKWGKDPFGAAIIWAEALGPTKFDGWNAKGEPVGKPYPTPLIVCLGTSEDQPLALDTAVPTPDGWSTVGALKIGDAVFDHLGNPTRVTRATPVLLGQRCYRVVFSDGEQIVTSADHGWTVQDGYRRGGRRRERTLTTEQLAVGLRSYDDRYFRYRVPATAVWDLPDAELSIDPYLLGLWLGDGSTADASVAFDWRQRDEIESIVEPLLLPGESIRWHRGKGNTGQFRIGRGGRGDQPVDSLRERLRELGVLGNKHIPAKYLRASAKQRLSLLQGLVDSDGHVERNGRAGFTSTNRSLIDQTAELLTTLGYKWYLRKDSHVEAWRLQWVPDDEPIARLSAKWQRQRSRKPDSHSAWRQIVAVEPVDSVPVRCVGIDTPDHLFLVGKRAVPTHNTDNTWSPCLSMGRNGPLVNMRGLDIGQTRIMLPGEGKIEPVTTSARARLGAPMTFATITESHLFTLQGGYRKVVDAVKRNIAGMDGRWMELTNAWDPTEASAAQVTAETANERIYINTVEPRRVEVLEDDEDLYRELLRQYGDSARERGGWVNIRGRIFHEVRNAAFMEADRRRFFLNEIVVGQSVFVSPERWNLLGADHDPDDVLEPKEEISLGFDGSKRRDATALIAERRRDRRLFVIRVWERPANATADWKIPSQEVDQVVRETFGAYKVGALFADPFRWQDYMDAWSGEWPDRVLEFATNQEMRMDRAIERFTTACAEHQIKHDASDVLARHVRQCVLVKGTKRKERPGEEGGIATHYMKMAKRGENQWIDAAVASVLAHEAMAHAIEQNTFAKLTDAEPWVVTY